MSPFEILLVEDNEADIEITQEALAHGGMNCHINVVGNGELALQFLRKQAAYENAPTPDLVLLDLNLPGLHGRDILAEIKSDERLKVIPVVVLTTSSALNDVQRAYDLHANAFMTKPAEFETFVTLINATVDYWFNSVHLPPKQRFA